MDETELREHLRVELNDLAPPADLLDDALRQLGSRRRSARRVALIGAVGVAVVALIVMLTFAASGSHRRVRVTETPTTVSAELAGTTSIDPIPDLLDRHSYGAEYVIAVERGVASCMLSKGWSYLPRVANRTNVYGAGGGPTDPTALLEYRKAYGYGYLNATPGDPAAEAAIDNANAKYVQSLSPAARLRYASDLGTGPDERAIGASSEAVSGCRAKSEGAERRIIPTLPQAVEHELFTQWATVATDPTYLTAQQQWSTCMSRAGFHFRRVSDAQASISNLFAPPASDPQSTASARAQANTESLRHAAELERRTGTADAKCAVTTVWPVQRQLELTILQHVIDQYGHDIVCGTSCI
jgi:hypothetical protein